MNKRKTLLLSACMAGAVAVILLAVALLRPSASIDWPEFSQPKSAEPQVVVMVEPDFGYHIGDVVKVDIFVRQPAGTAVDTGSMALQGDFEVRGEPIISSETRDGEVYIRIRLFLQSFQAFKPTYSATLSMVYEKAGDKNAYEVKAPPIAVGTSNTWDGRDANQEGKLAPWYGSQLAWTSFYLASGLLGLIGLTLLIRKVRKAIPEPPKPKTPLSPRQKAKIRFDRVWKRIRAGDQSERNFREIDVIVRKLERIENVILEHVPIAIGDNHPRKAQVMHILHECERVIFGGARLQDEELDVLEAAFNIYIGAVPLRREKANP